jgi:hypothetical protein
MNPAYESPEIAVLYEFEGMPIHVAASAREGDDAYLVVDLGEGGQPHLHGISAIRGERGWEAGAGDGVAGWTPTDPEHALGTAVAWGPAPQGAVRVRASLDGDTREVPVARDVYLVAWWRVPRPDAGVLRVEAFHVGGRWIPATPEQQPGARPHPSKRSPSR